MFGARLVGRRTSRRRYWTVLAIAPDRQDDNSDPRRPVENRARRARRGHPLHGGVNQLHHQCGPQGMNDLAKLERSGSRAIRRAHRGLSAPPLCAGRVVPMAADALRA